MSDTLLKEDKQKVEVVADGKEHEELLRKNPFVQFECEREHGSNSSGGEKCGFACCKPKWLQLFATKQAFMIVFSILAIVQGMSWSYFTATITTLEKRFKISSQTAGIVMTGNELSQVLFSIIISYYGSRGHRPRWIAIGVLFSALSCFLLASPHIFYGSGTDALNLVYEDYSSSSYPGGEIIKNETNTLSEKTGKYNRVQLCDTGSIPPKEVCTVGDLSIVPLILIFISQFVAGIGVLLFFSLGGPYLDDNIEKTQSPMLFGITMCLRLVGPLLGFLLASACLSVFINPTLRPFITNDDPRWIGAWWLGWVILGGLMMITSFFIAMFPRELPESRERRLAKHYINKSGNKRNSVMSIPNNPADLANVGSQIFDPSSDNHITSIREMLCSLKALIRNKVNIFNTISSVFYLFSMIGYWTYMPKYLETMFMQTAISASTISGTVSIAFQAAGLLLSGFLISKFQPSARKLSGWNAGIGLLYVIAMSTFTQMGCDPGVMDHGASYNDGGWNLTKNCNMDCNCRLGKMLPVCHKDSNTVYYSACHAGCQIFNSTSGIGAECSCLPSLHETAQIGTCSEGCYKIFITFLAVNAFMKLIDSSGRIGNMLVGYRCVDPSEKSLAIGLGVFLISIFALLPSPIFFGAIFDRTCLVWGTKCGGKGNCWLYDGKKLRYTFNLSAAVFTFIGAFFDILVWYFVKDLDLYDEDKNIENRRNAAKK